MSAAIWQIITQAGAVGISLYLIYSIVSITKTHMNQNTDAMRVDSESRIKLAEAVSIQTETLRGMNDTNSRMVDSNNELKGVVMSLANRVK